MLVARLVAATVFAASTTAATTAPSRPPETTTTSPAAIAAFMAKAKVPSFSRQTKLACSVCHNGFPQLTPFGRMFKLNGYTMTGLTPITQPGDSAARPVLELSPIAPLSVMVISSATRIAKNVPDQQNLTAQFPQELSFFASTAISGKMGIFSQFTYEDQSGTFAIDNVDLRFANHTRMGGKDVLYGLTLHNNPTVQDVWNTTPAWSYPFTSAGVAPAPGAATLIDGGLGQAVVGLGAYSLINEMLYLEVSGYVAAPQATSLPLNSSSENTSKAVSPYWRLALQHQTASTYMMAGTFGLSSHLYPVGISGPTNRFTDVGVDGQLEQKVRNGMLIARGSYIHETQTLSASFLGSESENAENTLNGYKLNLSYMPNQTHSLSVGLFGTTGSSDNLLYTPEAVTGSAAGRPDSQGGIVELAVSPWLNTRLGAQYVMYQKFNGASKSYDVAQGRSARDNNTLYLYLWLAY